jgi:putative ABC transport system permease protein
VLTLTLRDLRYRWRQFAIAVVGAALVFGLTLLLTGMTAGFDAEVESTVAGAGAERWVVPSGVAGPFTADAPVPERVGRLVASARGVTGTGGFTAAQSSLTLPGGEREAVNVIGQDDDGLVQDGLVPPAGGAVVSDLLPLRRGDRFGLGPLRLRVTGVTPAASYFAGVPIVRVRLADAQKLAFRGRTLVTAVLTRGVPEALPRGYAALTPAQVRADLGTPVDSAKSTIAAVRLLMWLVAALIIGAVTYLSALDRVRDFAVLKAVGAESRTLAASLVVQAVLAAVLAAALAVGVSRLMEPAVTLPVVFEAGAAVLLLVVAFVVGVLASLVALARALRVDPALAFGG